MVGLEGGDEILQFFGELLVALMKFGEVARAVFGLRDAGFVLDSGDYSVLLHFEIVTIIDGDYDGRS